MKVKHFFGLIGYVVLGLIITVLLIKVKDLVEQQPFGHRIEMLAYEFLQWQLIDIDEERPPVVVADIGQMPGGKPDQPTSREELTKIIAAMADKKPRAIALDIDFSPGERGWLHVSDPAFFDLCLKIKREKRVPIFLGVYRTQRENPDTWLGLEKYKELAASVVILKDTSRMPRWIQAEGVSESLPTISAMLAQSYKKSLPGPPDWLAWSVETIGNNQPGSQIQPIQDAADTYAVTPVNYSKLDAIKLEAHPIMSAASVAESGDKFHDRVVIIGDASHSLDTFVVPGRDTPVPGVLLHACAAYTFIKEPLYEFKHGIRVGLDLFISFVIILAVALIRFLHAGDLNYSWHKRQRRFVKVAVVFVLLTGILLVRLVGVMWLDFFLVVFVLLLHPSVEGWVVNLVRRKQKPKSAVLQENQV